MITNIRASVGEAEAYKAALLRGEVGIQRPLPANLPGADFTTAARGRGGQWTIFVNAAKLSTVGKFPSPKTAIPIKWGGDVRAALKRLDLGNPHLEAQIKAAYGKGRVVLRQGVVIFS